MKTKNITNLVATAAFAVASVTASFAQQNLGASCGCPSVASRGTPIALSTLAVSGGPTDGELIASNTVLTCNNAYRLDKKIYVPNGKSITIAPGTVIYGDPNPGGDPTQAVALVVERGGKIFANGTAECQIVFTAIADPMNGTYGVSHHGDWGGVVILGKATNNLTLANATNAFPGGTCVGASCFGTGVGTGFIEGFIAADSRNQYGGTDDNDNSGIFRYVSIRHAGAVINAIGNELNGLTLGSVGRGTTIDHIEIIASNDDGIEFFGGTVDIKYAAVMFGMDDMFDWDQGYRGRLQFLFGLAGDSITCPSTDNGFECDGDDQKTCGTPLSKPIVYNATIIGNKSLNQNVFDNSAHAAINAKEYTGGEIYNSIFANFETGFNMQQSAGTRTCGGPGEAYSLWSPGTDLKVSCNSFIGNAEGLKLNKSKTSDGVGGSGPDLTKFNSTDANTEAPSLAGFDFNFTMNTSTNAVSDKYDAEPNPAVTTTCTAPVDGFFSVAAYKGAFASSGPSWLSPWAYSVAISVGTGEQPCPTDLDGNGVTNNVDFLQLLGEFNQNCD